MLNTVHTPTLKESLSSVAITKIGDGIYRVTDAKKSETVIEVLAIDLALKTIKIRNNHSVHEIEFKDDLDLVLDKMGIKRNVETISTDVKAPMPGKVISILVKSGDAVSKGDGILILEAMKMENVLKAENDCVIKKVLIEPGISVEKNQILVELA